MSGHTQVPQAQSLRMWSSQALAIVNKTKEKEPNMSSPFIGEIRMFAGNFAPQGWAFCNGALMAIDQNDALFNLIGTTYGGDGQTTFALPNLQSRVPVHVGPGFALGQSGGTESVTLTTSQIPAHSHVPLANAGSGSQPN